MKIRIGVLTALIISAGNGFSQVAFQNLDFELANPGPVTSAASVPVAIVIPFWNASYSGVEQTDVSYNLISTGATQVALTSEGNPGFGAIDGNYSVLLQGIVPGSTASISQTGLIPTGAESLLFEAQPGSGPLGIYVGGQIVSFSSVGSGPNYNLYGANISAWNGDTEDITFSAFGGSYNNWLIDDISFSTTPIVTPEPSPFVLTAIGGVVFALYRRVTKKLKVES